MQVKVVGWLKGANGRKSVDAVAYVVVESYDASNETAADVDLKDRSR
jgi:hypothetical protein